MPISQTSDTRNVLVHAEAMRRRILSASPLAGDDVQCRVCGLWGQWLGTHIRRVHGLSASRYRQDYDIRDGEGLASVSLRNAARVRAHEMIETGVLRHDHLPTAVEAARVAARRMCASARQHQREATKAARPGDHHKLPDGAKRADGRDAGRARKTQQQRRAKKRDIREPQRRLVEAYLSGYRPDDWPGNSSTKKDLK